MKKAIYIFILILLFSFHLDAQDLPSFFKPVDGPPSATTYASRANPLSNGDFILAMSEYIDDDTKFDIKIYTLHPQDASITAVTIPLPDQQIMRDARVESGDIIWLAAENFDVEGPNNVSDVLILRLDSNFEITGSFQLDIDLSETVKSILPLGNGRVAVHSSDLTANFQELDYTKISVIDMDNQAIVWTKTMSSSIHPSFATDGDNQLLITNATGNFQNYRMEAYNISDGAAQWINTDIPTGCSQEHVNRDLLYLPSTNSYIGMSPCYGLIEIEATGEMREDRLSPIFSSDPTDYFSSIDATDTNKLRIVTTSRVIDVERNADGEFELEHIFALPSNGLVFPIGTIDHQGYIVYSTSEYSSPTRDIEFSIIPVDESGVSGPITADILTPFEIGSERLTKNFHIAEDGTRLQTILKSVGFLNYKHELAINSDEENATVIPLGDWQIDMLYPTETEGVYYGPAYKATDFTETENIYMIRADETGVIDSIFLFESKIYIDWHFRCHQASNGNIVLVTQERNVLTDTNFSRTRTFTPEGEQINFHNLPASFNSYFDVKSLLLSNNDMIYTPSNNSGNFLKELQRHSEGEEVASSLLNSNSIPGDFFIGNITESPDGSQLLVGGAFRVGFENFTFRPTYFLFDATTLDKIEVVGITLEDHENGGVAVANFLPHSDKILLQYGAEDTRSDVTDSLHRHTVMVLEKDGTVLRRQQSHEKNYGYIRLSQGILHEETLYAVGQTLDKERFENVAFIAGTILDEVVSIDEIPSASNDLSIKIYPNPSSNQLEISWQQKGATYQVHLLDNSGRPIRDWTGSVAPGQAFLRTSVAHLPVGMYLIQIQTEDGILTKSFVRQ